MPRPGTTTVVADALPPATAPTDTGVGFFVGEAQRGPTDVPVMVRTPQSFVERFGERLTPPALFDGIEAFFREGGARAYVLRLVDEDAAAASVTRDGVTVDAASPGEWGDTIEIELLPSSRLAALDLEPGLPRLSLAGGASKRASATPMDEGDESPEDEDGDEGTPPEGPDEPDEGEGDGEDGNGDGETEPPPIDPGPEPTPEPGNGEPLALVVRSDGEVVERALSLRTAGDLAAWSAGSAYIRVTADDEETDLTAGRFELTGGQDGGLPVTDPYALLETAMRFDSALGPGQLQAPGKTELGQHEALLKAAAPGNRVVILDGDPAADVPALAAHVQALRSIDEQRFGGLWAQRAVIPGLAVGTTRTVPWSAIQAGMQSRQDASGNPNQAAAGSFGISRFATGLTREFTDIEREQLMHAGVNTAKMVYGQPRSYGVRTLVDENGPQRSWLWFSNARLAMAIKARGDAIAETYVFRSIDGRRRVLAAFGGELSGMCQEYWPEGLYGETVAEAFRVVVDETVNTDGTIEAGEIRAVIGLHMAPPAEWVFIQIVKQAIIEAL